MNIKAIHNLIIHKVKKIFYLIKTLLSRVANNWRRKQYQFIKVKIQG